MTKNIKNLFEENKAVSAKAIFDGSIGKVTAIQILEGQLLKKHSTKTPALLICIFGKVNFENEKGENHTLSPGHYLEIAPTVEHWVKGIKNSQLLLVK